MTALDTIVNKTLTLASVATNDSVTEILRHNDLTKDYGLPELHKIITEAYNNGNNELNKIMGFKRDDEAIAEYGNLKEAQNIAQLIKNEADNYKLALNAIVKLNSITKDNPSLSGVINSVIKNKVQDLTIKVQNLAIQHNIDKEKSNKTYADMAKKILDMDDKPKIKGLDYDFKVDAFINGVSGDAIDVFEIEPGKYGIMVLDVAGKGPAASVYANRVFGYIKGSKELNPGKVLAELEQKNIFTGYTNYGVMFYGVYDENQGKLIYSGGGLHVFHEKNGKIESQKEMGTPIGLGTFMPLMHILELNKGDKLLISTDGLCEHRDMGSTPNNLSYIHEAMGEKEAKDVIKELYNKFDSQYTRDDDASAIVLIKK